jgi:hypothetical protein
MKPEKENISKFTLSITVLVMLLLLFISGCSQIENVKINDKESAKPIELSLQNNIKVYDIEKFKKELSEFHDFLKDFYYVWVKYSTSSQPLIEKFNDENTTIYQKNIYAEQLGNESESFLKEFSNIKIPIIAQNAYKYEYDAISKRKIAFESFRNYNDNEFSKNITESYTNEKEFWKEIDRIFKEIDLQAKEMGIGNNPVIKPEGKEYPDLQA